MDGNAFNFGIELNNQKLQFVLSPKLWEKFSTKLDLKFSNWNSIKYLDDLGQKFNSEVDTLPDKAGGLYLFYLPCDIIQGITDYPLYIGRAQLTDNQNLKKRIKEYFQHYNNDKERPKIFRMLRIWGNVVRVAYLPIVGNNEIIQVEEDLINSLVPPMNDLIPNKKIKDAIKAFDS